MNIVLIGAQGAGKGIVSEYLSEKYGFNHISTGELFREEISKGTELGEKLSSYMNKGLLVPDEIVFSILEKALNNSENSIIDGFPRNMVQAKKLSELINIDLVIFVDAPRHLLVDRMSARRICPKCKTGYSMLFRESNLCDKCGTEIVQREDDVAEAINKRLEIFYQNIKPILNYYENQNVLQTLDNSKDLQHVYKELEKIVKNYIF